MAQWIPKTAWKASSLNRRYGPQYMAQGYPTAQNPDRVLASYAMMDAQPPCAESVLKQKISAALKPTPANPVAGAVVLDTRDDPERRYRPLHSPAVVHVHPHDLLSGAARPILPSNPAKTELFLVASDAGRAVNSTEALRRWGYDAVHVVDYAVVANVLKALQV